MALDFATDTTLAKQIKRMISRATASTVTLTPAQQTLLFMSATAAAGNIGNEALRLATIKWIFSRSNRVDISIQPEPEDGSGE